jgi:hypothetical protein
VTVALCLVCGDRKAGAFVPCSRCCWEPRQDEDRVRSLLSSDQFQPTDELERIGAAIARGTELVIPPELVAEVLHSSGAALAGLGPLSDPAPEGSPARAAQLVLQEPLREVEGLAHSRSRYLHALATSEALDDEVTQAVREGIAALRAAPDPSQVTWLRRCLCLPFAPFVSLMAAVALGLEEQDRLDEEQDCEDDVVDDVVDDGRLEPEDLAVQRLMTLSPGAQRQVLVALANLLDVIGGAPVDYLAELERRLSSVEN